MSLLIQPLILILIFACSTNEEVLPSATAPAAKCSEEATSMMHSESHCNQSLSCSGDLSCPPGLFCKKGQCECGVYPFNIIVCNDTSTSISHCNCATFDPEWNVTVGACIFNCRELNKNSYQNLMYEPLPRDINKLNDKMCKPWNRDGALCGRCLPDHYPLAYSFDSKCIRCPHVGWNWLKYIMAAYLPVTLFYMAILFFKINVTSSHLFPIVFFCQTISVPVLLRIIYIVSYKSSYAMLGKVIASLYGIWNLDFFRPFYSDICLGMGPLPTLALDYAIAVYPLLLMVITYLLIVLYDRNYRVITMMWRPFRVLFSYYRRNWDVRTSVIDAYATFFLLSNVKFLSVSFDLLIPTRAYKLHHDHYNTALRIYYAGHISYLNNEHLPYAILAMFVSIVFVTLPILVLAVYPFAFFQRFLNLFPLRWYILHTFVDSFQGCYKDGTEPGTCDCRWFSSIFFIFRILLYIVYAATLNIVFFVLAAVMFIALALTIMTIKPFKLAYYNTINAVSMQFLAITCTGAVGAALSTAYMHHISYLFYVQFTIGTLLPVIYVFIHAFYWIAKNRTCAS